MEEPLKSTPKTQAFKIQLASDLHLEINQDISFEEILEPCASILILAGDIGNPADPRYTEFLEWCAPKYEKVILIAGNHEYYSLKGKPQLTINQRKELIKDICTSIGDHIRFLDNEALELSDDIVIIGTTLWSYIKPKERIAVEYCLNDFNHIYIDESTLLSVARYNEMHTRSYMWLREEIDSYPDKTVIVVSHHLPSFKFIDSKFKSSPTNSAFASDLDHLFKRDNVKYWFYGHSHASNDVVEEGCRLIANPHGYSRVENRSYRKDLCIDISNGEITYNLPRVQKDGDKTTYTIDLVADDGSTYKHTFEGINPEDVPKKAWI